jgi:molybdenum cofactor biosynthesis enzyme MoaA
MTPEEIRAHEPDQPASDWRDTTRRARRAMVETGQWRPGQVLGRRWAVGCVALEITQRCNLDCTLCYLSDHAEAVKDIPLEEVWRRIETIRGTYGPGTNVQVTGGDPTLRKRRELVAIVRRLRERELLPALFTNGIKATRDLLRELKEVGLVDVAFHVDTTQERKGYRTEADLNAVRRDYIERARGLGLAVHFNTTVHDGNVHEVADLARFFVANCDAVELASFQLQADTGRGTQRERDAALVSVEGVARRIRAGVEGTLSFDGKSIGHAECNRYAMALVANGRAHDLLEEGGFVPELLRRTAEAEVWLDRTRRRDAARKIAGFLARHPGLALRGAGWLAATGWRMRRDLLAGRGKVGKLSFFIHNFMDACHLDRDRVKACSFKVVTADGPISMCLHNAKRDEFILKPIRVAAGEGAVRYWDPLTGQVGAAEPPPPGRRTVVVHPKLQKGRGREAALRQAGRRSADSGP